MIPELNDFPNISLKNIERLIENRIAEGYYVEYKSEFPGKKSIAKGLASFANTRGGFFIIGLKANDQNEADGITPVSLERNVIDQINDIRSTIDKPVECDHEVIYTDEDKSEGLIIIRVRESPYLPHFYEGRIYVREGESSKPIALKDYYLINELFLKRDRLHKGTLDYITSKVSNYLDIITNYNSDKKYYAEECIIIMVSYPFPIRDNLVEDIFAKDAGTKYRIGSGTTLYRHNEDCLSYTSKDWITAKNGVPLLPKREELISHNGTVIHIENIPIIRGEPYSEKVPNAKEHGVSGIEVWRFSHFIENFIYVTAEFYKRINYSSTLRYELFLAGVEKKSLIPVESFDPIHTAYEDNVKIFARLDEYHIGGHYFEINGSNLENEIYCSNLVIEFYNSLLRCFNLMAN